MSATDPRDRKFLSELSQELRTQDGRSSAEPYFIVQQKHRIYGMDEAHHCDGVVWLFDSEEPDVDEEKHARAEYERTLVLPEGWERVAFVDIWVFVQAFLTEKSANAYVKRNRHRMVSPRVYAESAFRNQEIIRLREILKEDPSLKLDVATPLVPPGWEVKFSSEFDISTWLDLGWVIFSWTVESGEDGSVWSLLGRPKRASEESK